MEGKEDISKKRKNTSTSSTSECSIVEDKEAEEIGGKKSKQKKKKSKVTEQTISEKEDSVEEAYSVLQNELREINKKLNNVVKKDDNSIKDMMREIIKEMKDDLLKSVIGRIEKIEGYLFETQKENDKLKEEIRQLKQEADISKDEKIQLQRECEKSMKTIEGKLNDLEQYDRRNNVRVTGIKDKERETAEDTIKTVIETLNSEIPGLNLEENDIDVAHRLGKFEQGKKRQIIVRLKRRMIKYKIMRQKKSLKGKNIYISEDLTKLNQEVFSSVRKKMKDVVSAAWTQDGAIKYRDYNDHIQVVHHTNYKYWLDLPWP